LVLAVATSRLIVPDRPLSLSQLISGLATRKFRSVISE
jgi:hypothetical protein